MNLNLKFDKKTLISVGEKGWRFTKKVGVKGLQALAAETLTKTLNASFEGGIDKAKEQLTFDAIVGPKKESKPKKKWFSKKKDVVEEALEEIDKDWTEIEKKVEELEDKVEEEIVDKKSKK